jgi:hypothetical protein
MTLRRAFRIHAWAFAAGVAVLTGVNWLTGSPWWSFWPTAAWGLVFGVHYLVYKARTTGESWADERVADLHSKSYDAGHIDRIAEDFRDKNADREKQ